MSCSSCCHRNGQSGVRTPIDPPSDEIMRNEAAGVAGDGRCIFAQTYSGRLIADYPGSDGNVAIVEFWDRGIRLIDPSLLAIAPALAQHLAPSIDGHVGAFPRIHRLLDVVAGNAKAIERRR